MYVERTLELKSARTPSVGSGLPARALGRAVPHSRDDCKRRRRQILLAHTAPAFSNMKYGSVNKEYDERVVVPADSFDSEYDFVLDSGSPPSSPDARASPGPSTPKGWSTLDLSERPPEPKLADPAMNAPFQCVICASLLRDCVECPRCHGLFCRHHLRVDNGRSPCPVQACAGIADIAVAAEGCGSSNLPQASMPAESFLPNIPVQRMADAVPSACGACGIGSTWGKLGAHTCDLQEVACEDARWGCAWIGKRGQAASHAASPCPGRLSRVESELAEARAELAAMRMELEAETEARGSAECRAASAEAQSEELSAELLAADMLRKRNASPPLPPVPKSRLPILPLAKAAPVCACGRLVKVGESAAVLPDAVGASSIPVPPKAPGVEAACQAPVPATDACLRPYLDRPESLLKKKIAVFWPRQGKWYVGRPTKYKAATKEHRVEYDDGDVRDHNLAHRSWGLIG